MAHQAAAPPQRNALAPYAWFSRGDLNGFFGLIIDNMAVMSFLAFILTVIFQFPAEIVFKRMFPGTALGVLFGDLVYTWMAFRLARRTGNPHVTAMPLGLDTPSTIGIGFTVLGPAFIAFKSSGLSPEAAGLQTWYLGMGTMVLIGTIKLALSFAGNWVGRMVPQAGLLGSLAGIGLALIGFLPLIDIFSLPVVGILSMGLLFYSVVAGIRLPRHFPGVLFSILVGTLVYYLLATTNLLGFEHAAPKADLHLALPMPTLAFWHSFVKQPGLPTAWDYFPIAFPFALLTIIGGINVTESARVAGDNYNTRSILLTEALATLLAGITGGVAQSTPYIGQPAYKAMGSRAGYTLLTGLFIGLAGFTGLIGYIVDAIPRAALAPVLVFVALDIVSQSFLACPRRHAPAVAFAFLPTVARLLSIKYGALLPAATMTEQLAKSEKALPEVLVTIALGNGFILTGMLWGAFLAKLIDRKLKTAALFLACCGVLSLFGVIHSPDPDGKMCLPWQLRGHAQQLTVQFTIGYLALAAMLLLLSRTQGAREPIEDNPLHG